ncbi:MAG: biotin--[acetyl-CoA-carboxylase] ligase [Candidatus Melainabacteria bacterium]|nr:biotin--[acetyl-CoA-carboxylase] ligase [Candidatus Melainabacteria bacterium]
MSLEVQNKFYLDTVDSTNEEAKRLIDSGKITNTSYIVANEQTSGKGTRGRIWISPKGAGIYLSVVQIIARSISDEATSLGVASPSARNEFTKSAGIACVEAIKEICNINTQLKPLNDIYIEGKKLGGILVETRLKENKLSALITGIGINTHKAKREINDLTVKPISLEEIMPNDSFSNFSKERLIEAVVTKVLFWHKYVFNNNSNLVEEKWKSSLYSCNL